jgi:shikimate dehydrogenase
VTKLFGVLGFPISHSRSPAMHTAALRATGIDGMYVPLAIPPERVPELVAALRALNVQGVNVTLPLKTVIMPLLDELTPAARAVAAVNTVIARNGQLLGDNTDAEGLSRSLLAEGVALAGANVVVLGAGGAARASVYGLALAGAARIAIAARNVSEAERLARELAPACGNTALRAFALGNNDDLKLELSRASLLVQSTSATLETSGVGSAAARAFAEALPLDELPVHAAVVDLVYKPRQTAVLERAKQRGLKTVDGLGMLLHQGALAFERWTGVPAPLEAMRRALLD